MKKGKALSIAIYVGLAILVAVVVVTSIIIHSKRKKLEDLKDKNEAIKPDESQSPKENKIFFKNFAIFIDNDLEF